MMLTSSRQDRSSMEEIRRNKEETNRRLEEVERWANDAEMSRDELGLEMVNQARKIEELKNWKARLRKIYVKFWNCLCLSIRDEFVKKLKLLEDNVNFRMLVAEQYTDGHSDFSFNYVFRVL